ncbi:hypothetical protein LN042_18370 [Kitasatospora sp. RB6PN24]|uniref:hypothetical protein n=1 Tax=Kitasatospora humi TaxID=2893891 RepID=UPI001E367841|nr:hypothetical protein [Kitasatospora humi]MCC9309026.1 hypothetical protein [Kitasatospora humi]
MRLPRPLICLPLAAALTACGPSGAGAPKSASSPAVSSATTGPSTASVAPSATATATATTATATTATATTATATTATATDPAALSAGELFRKALEATDSIETLKADAQNTAGPGDTDHLEIDQLGGNCAGTMVSGGTPYLSFVIKTQQVWERLEAGYWAAHPSSPAADQLKGHYVKVPESFKNYHDLVVTCELSTMLPLLLDVKATMVKGGSTTVDGHPAIWIIRGSSSILVSLEDKPYIRQLKNGTKTLTLSGFNSPVSITEPPADQVIATPSDSQLPPDI